MSKLNAHRKRKGGKAKIKMPPASTGEENRRPNLFSHKDKKESESSSKVKWSDTSSARTHVTCVIEPQTRHPKLVIYLNALRSG